ncbi:MAG: hypothetical protein GY944_27765, partial [bacterium]|nr:hypothetical protein [bacterium]
MALLDLLPRARPRLAAVIALVVFAGLSLARMLGAFEVAELPLYDRDLRTAAQQAVEAPPIMQTGAVGGVGAEAAGVVAAPAAPRR